MAKRASSDDTEQGVSVAVGFGKRLKKAREDAGYSQTDLAKRLDIAPTTISRNERDLAAPRAALLEAYCQELNVTEAYLRFGVGGPNPHAELVEGYLASPLGARVRPDVAKKLRQIRFAELGISIPTLDLVHDLRILFERHLPPR